MRVWLLILALAVLPFKAVAEERGVTLYAPPALVDSGVLKYALPRFSLKTQVRVTLVDSPEAAEIVLGAAGVPLFQGAGAVWALDSRAETEWTAKLADWLTGEIGRNTVLSYAPDGVALFTPPPEVTRTVAAVALTGDPALGHRVARAQCARCHAVDDATRMGGIGSSPSFAVLRSLPGWQARFTGFYALNPHPSFTQIAEVTPPFDHTRPSPIVPVEMTLDEVEAVLAYVAGMTAADLGAPLAHQ